MQKFWWRKNLLILALASATLAFFGNFCLLPKNVRLETPQFTHENCKQKISESALRAKKILSEHEPFFIISIYKLRPTFKVILLVVIDVLEYFAKNNFDFNGYYLNAQTSSKGFSEKKMA